MRLDAALTLADWTYYILVNLDNISLSYAVIWQTSMTPTLTKAQHLERLPYGQAPGSISVPRSLSSTRLLAY